MSAQQMNVRSDDSGTLKYNGLNYIVRDQDNDSVQPVLSKKSGKSARGWAHPMTARLLCPRSMLEEFDFDATTCEPGAVDPE